MQTTQEDDVLEDGKTVDAKDWADEGAVLRGRPRRSKRTRKQTTQEDDENKTAWARYRYSTTVVAIIAVINIVAVTLGQLQGWPKSE